MTLQQTKKRTRGNLPPRIKAVLSRLRWRIRRYVLLEGLATAIVFVGIAFWVGLALDYVPVLLGAHEMPRAARLLLLVVISIGLLTIVYRLIMRRLFVRLAAPSLAILIERHFPDLNESLVTSVELADESPPQLTTQTLLARTVQQADTKLAEVPLDRVLNRRPLVRRWTLAGVLMASVLALGLFSRDALATWTTRMLLLSDQPWPRRAHIELLEFPNRQRIVARGADLTIRVRADATRPTLPPDRCVLYYELEDGEHGKALVSRVGEPRDGYQYYEFKGKPFQGMLASVTFDVVGFDHRLEGFQVRVVDSPSIAQVMLSSRPPAYTGRLPRTDRWQAGTRLPAGSSIDVKITTTKGLLAAEIHNLNTDETEQLTFDAESPPRSFQFSIGRLRETAIYELSLLDTDQVRSTKPYRLTIGAVPDVAPQVNVLLQGIGTAVTPDARIPITGEITDDYQVQRAWFDVVKLAEKSAASSDAAESEEPNPNGVETAGTEDGDSRLEFDFAPDRIDQVALDLRRLRRLQGDQWRLRPGEQIQLTIQATDYCDLAGEPNVGQGDSFSLKVVAPEELLAILEAREVGLKRRFEQTIAEVESMRDDLTRLRNDLSTIVSSPEPPAEADQSEEPHSDRDWSLRLLQTQRGRQQSEKSQQEVSGIAASFDDIRQELVNNRIDTEERKQRLQNDIIDPLEQIAVVSFPQLQATLAKLETQLETQSANAPLAREAVEETTQLLLAMEQVLAKMIELESFNELVDLMRSILQEQEAIRQKTEEQRRREARSLLED